MTISGAPEAVLVSRSAAIERLFEASRHGLYVGWLDPGDPAGPGTPLLVNQGLKSLLGYAPDTGDSAVSLFGRDRYADSAARDRLLQAIVGESGARDHLVQLRRQDEVLIWVEITGAATPHSPGPLRVDLVVRDVTERRQREEQARDLYQQLAHSEQLAAVGRTLADVAHELRNPLAAIVGWAERLAQQTLDEKTARGVSEILAASERAARIVRNMVHSPGRQASTRAMMDVNEVVADTLALRLHDQQATNIVATVDLGENLPPVFADSHQIQQILLNVIINAEHAMVAAHKGGELTLRTFTDARRQHVIIEVCDDGPGVPEAVRSRIFDPFFTTKEPGTGTGLGLAVAQALAHEHGGSVRLAHDRPSGTTFLIELPARDLAAPTR